MNEEIKKQIVDAHWNVFTNQDKEIVIDEELQALHEYIVQDSEYEVAKKKADGYFLTSDYELDDLAEEKVERMENLGLDIIALTKNLWDENSTDFVVGLMVTITTESQLEALVEHLLDQIQRKGE